MIINDLAGHNIVFDTKNRNTELDTLAIKLSSSLPAERDCRGVIKNTSVRTGWNGTLFGVTRFVWDVFLNFRQLGRGICVLRWRSDLWLGTLL